MLLSSRGSRRESKPVASLSHLLAALPALLLLLAPGRASAQNEADTAAEAFASKDPYTKGEPARLERLGYRSLGPFQFLPNESTGAVRETLGGVEILWVETEHFKLGSTLTSYRFVEDAEERTALERELTLFAKRLGRPRPTRKELDPWLRLHLYAQRIELLYADFCARLGIDESRFPPDAPYLGQREKFLVLICEQKSSLGRFLARYAGVQQDFFYRYPFPQGGFFVGISAEGLAQTSTGLDIALHTAVASGVVELFLDAYRENYDAMPAWLRFGLAHSFARRVDPRWVPGAGEVDGTHKEDYWRWDRRVLNLVQNDYFAPMSEMLGWRERSELNVRDHMIAWSKVEYLLELEGTDLAAFVDALSPRLPEGPPEKLRAELVARQTAAFPAHLGITPDDFDRAFAKHVRRKYR